MRHSTARRPSLLRKLDAGLTHRLLLLVGPAPLADRLLDRWIDRSPWPVARLRLRASDNAPEVFLADVAAALDDIALDEGQRMGGKVDAEAGVPALINRMAGVEDGFLLVLAGYGLIQAPVVHRMVSLFIDYPPPAGHLILTAAQEPPLPLARWRARRQLAVVRLPALRLWPGRDIARRKT